MLKFTRIVAAALSLLPLMSYAQSAGNLDASFGNGGKVITSVNPGQDKAYGVALQPDGKILVAGSTVNSNTGKDFVCLRYKTDGSLDSTFGTNGIVTTDLQIGSEDAAYSIALQNDGKIVLAGYTDNGTQKDAAIVRYLTDGSLDTSFNHTGMVFTDYDSSRADELKVVKIHALTGNIIVGGQSIKNASVSKPVIARYLSNGVLDTSFNHTGIKTLWVTSLDYQYQFSVEDLNVQPNGKIFGVGYRNFAGLQWDSDYWACKINTNGTMDITFSNDGVETYNNNFNGHDRLFAVLPGNGNNFLVGGGAYLTTLAYDFNGFEILPDGNVGDFSGRANFGNLYDDIAYAMVRDNNGKIVTVGTSDNGTASKFAVARWSDIGDNDADFGTAGQVSTTFGSLNSGAYDGAVQTDNKIIAVGFAGNDIALARYNGTVIPQLDSLQLLTPANGSIEYTFVQDQFTWTHATGAVSYEIEFDTSATMATGQTLTVPTELFAGYADYCVPTYWRVRATDGTNFGAWTPTWVYYKVAVDSSQLVSPAYDSTDVDFANATLDCADGCASIPNSTYIFTVSKYSDLRSPVTYTSPTSEVNITNLDPSTLYYWSAEMKNNGNSLTYQPSAWRFSTKRSLTSINSLQESGITVYPNPTNDLITLANGENLIGKTYSLVDMTGKIMINGSILATANFIDLKSLPSGIYFLKITTQPTPIKIFKN